MSAAAAVTTALARALTLEIDFASPTKTSKSGSVKYRNARARVRDSGEHIDVVAFGDTSNPLRGLVAGGTYRATNVEVTSKAPGRLQIKAGNGARFEQLGQLPDPRISEKHTMLSALNKIPLACCSDTPPVVDVVGVVVRVDMPTTFSNGAKAKRVVRITDASFHHGSIQLSLMGAWATAFPELSKMEDKHDAAYPYVVAVREANLGRFRANDDLQLTAWDNRCSLALFDPATCEWARAMVEECVTAGVLDERTIRAHLAAVATPATEAAPEPPPEKRARRER